jgi:alpha-amylase
VHGRAVTLAVAAILALAGCQATASTSPTSTSASAGPNAPATPAAPGSPLPCVSADPGQAALRWGDRVFYELFVRSFADADGDGIGDLAGLTQRLDYLNDGDDATSDDLGVTALWLMPVAEAASYHGYDVVDYAAVERDYGDMAAMRAFVRAAHDRGMLVVVDFVINHTSREHPWFRDALDGGSHRDWYLWSAENPGWPAVAGPSPWHASGNGDFYYGAFWEGMPDLNLANPDVTAEIKRIAEQWLTDVGVDGFRIDAAKHLIEEAADAQVNTEATKAWLADFREQVHANHPDALVIGEVWDARAVTSAYTTGGSVDMAFDFGIGPAIMNGVYNGASTLLAAQEEVATRYGDGLAGTFLTNHDQARAMTTLEGDVAAARQSAETLLTSPGVPFIYYGEELGMVGDKPDERIRTPFPWTASAPGHGFTTGTPWEPFADGTSEANLEAATVDEAFLLGTYRELIQLRPRVPALAFGGLSRVETSDDAVAATVRAIGGQRLLVVQNLSEEPVAAPRLTSAVALLCGGPAARLLYPSEAGLDLASPVLTADGGFVDYVPVAMLPARATLVIDLSP